MDEFDKMLMRVSKNYKLEYSEVKEFLKDDLSKFSIKLGVKKRNRRVLPTDKQCMGRKLDGHQCTRGRYREDSEYCKSHANKLPLGRIDDKSNKRNHSSAVERRKWVRNLLSILSQRLKQLESKIIWSMIETLCFHLIQRRLSF